MPEPLTDADLDRLDALAAAATPGGWSWEDDPPTLYAGRAPGLHGLNLLGRLEPDRNGRENLDFICAADPDTVRRLVADLRAARAELAAHRKNRWLALDDNSPHDDPADCPSWYDWCNCTVASLRSVSDLAIRQRGELKTLREELAACRKALGPLADIGGELLRQNGGAAESCGCYVGGRHLVAAHRALTSARVSAASPLSPAAPAPGSAGEPPAAPGPG